MWLPDAMVRLVHRRSQAARREGQHFSDYGVIDGRDEIGHATGGKKGQFPEKHLSLHVVEVNSHIAEIRSQVSGQCNHPFQVLRFRDMHLGTRWQIFAKREQLPIQAVKILGVIPGASSEVRLHEFRFSVEAEELVVHKGAAGVLQVSLADDTMLHFLVGPLPPVPEQIVLEPAFHDEPQGAPVHAPLVLADDVPGTSMGGFEDELVGKQLEIDIFNPLVHPQQIVQDLRVALRFDVAADLKLVGAPGHERVTKVQLDPLRQADLLIGNLEFPLTDIGRGIIKCGPVLKGKTACLGTLKNAGFGLLGLANNHIKDCGDEGVLNTLARCREAGIVTVGAGENAAAARKPSIVQVQGWKVGIMAFAEHEFNAASELHCGANLLDLYYSFDQIREIRASCDFLIVLYHGGIEHYVYPSPLLQKKCRKMAESGADLVLCQHSHCVGTVEQFAGGTIVYGQGNTVFGYRPGAADWNEGLIVKVSLSEKSTPMASLAYLPIVAAPSGVDVMPADQAKIFLTSLHQRSQSVTNKGFIDRSWQRYCQARHAHYLPMLLGLGRVLNYANRKTKNAIVSTLFTKKRLSVTMNLTRCEAHAEVVRTILEQSVE